MYRRVKRRDSNHSFFILHPSIHSITFHFIEHSGRAGGRAKMVKKLYHSIQIMLTHYLLFVEQWFQMFHRAIQQYTQQCPVYTADDFVCRALIVVVKKEHPFLK